MAKEGMIPRECVGFRKDAWTSFWAFGNDLTAAETCKAAAEKLLGKPYHIRPDFEATEYSTHVNYKVLPGLREGCEEGKDGSLYHLSWAQQCAESLTHLEQAKKSGKSCIALFKSNPSEHYEVVCKDSDEIAEIESVITLLHSFVPYIK